MALDSNYIRLMDYMEGKGVINTHSHHMDDEFFQDLTLDKLLENSYVDWCGVSFGESRDSRKRYLDKVRYNSYFIWLQKAVKELYGMNKSITEYSWDEYSKSIKEAHKDENYHINILKYKCRYEKVILDTYWEPGSNNGHPQIFAPSYRINMFLFGYSSESKDHNGNNPCQVYGQNLKDIDEYVAFMRAVIIRKKEEGCVALKSALAYDRGLDFREVSREDAQKAFGRSRLVVTGDDIKNFQDYIFYEICKIASELHMPVQCHIGLGNLKNTNALNMQEVIEKNPDTKFVLFHGGYPWTDDVMALVHNYNNVYPDICWMPLISTSASIRMIDELIEVATIDKICWGCDTWTSEESYGALLALRHVLAKALSYKMEEEYISFEDSKVIIDHVLYKNAKELYGI